MRRDRQRDTEEGGAEGQKKKGQTGRGFRRREEGLLRGSRTDFNDFVRAKHFHRKHDSR